MVCTPEYILCCLYGALRPLRLSAHYEAHGGACGGSTAAEDGSEGGSEAGEGMEALGELFDDTNELAADALVFGAAEADYEEEDWGWADLNAAAPVPGMPGERPLPRILLPSQFHRLSSELATFVRPVEMHCRVAVVE